MAADRAAASEEQRRFRYPRRRPLDDRKLAGILFVLHTGIG